MRDLELLGDLPNQVRDVDPLAVNRDTSAGAGKTEVKQVADEPFCAPRARCDPPKWSRDALVSQIKPLEQSRPHPNGG
jgi:hypothetical protein